jgi:hypothetical protein
MFRAITKAVLILTSMGASLAHAATFYVAPTGSGTNSNSAGNTESNPWATLAYAAGRVSPGDTILLLPGLYHNATYNQTPIDIWKDEETVRINGLHGTAANWITIKPKTPGTVMMKGDGVNIFQIRNSSYVRIEGLIIEGETANIPLSLGFEWQFAYKDANGNIQYRINAPGTTPLTIAEIEALNNLPAPITATRPSYFSTVGLLVQSSHHMEVRNCLIHHAPGPGLRFQGCDYFDCIANEVHNCSRRSSAGNHGLVVHSLTSTNDGNSGHRVRILENKIHDNYNEIYSWSELKPFISPHLDEGKGISMQKNEDEWNLGRVLIANNVCWGNGFSGIHINEGERMDIINNTCYNNHFSGSGPNTGISVAGGDDITIRNNISVALNNFNGRAYSLSQATNITLAKNLAHGTVNEAVNAVATSLTFADPLFVNAGALNFQLTATSPAIGLADDAFDPATDILGAARVAAPDLGAYEYQPAALTPLQTWRQLHFGNPDNTGLGADSADPDFDGLTNITEYAFGLLPQNPSSNALPTFQFNGTHFSSSFTTPEEATGVTILAQWSTNLELNSWLSIPNTGTAPVHTFSLPTTGHNRLFVRFAITNQ